MNKKIINFLDNREFADNLANLNCKKDIKELFKEYGVDISDEELSSVLKFKKEIEKDLSALDDRELEKIGSGGAVTLALEILGAAMQLSETISKGFQNFANYKLSDTQAHCNKHIEVTRIKNNSEILRAKISATDHIIGYALIAAIAVVFMQKRKREIET